jgi:phage terminase small subunit|tara:strand:+ start:598 stop:972 length:375 start_codon:yes stop_codon:yes gene_type:complete
MKIDKSQSLTTRQQAFIDNLLTNGGTATQCAIKAGYSKKSAKVEASRLLKQDKVLKALQTQAMKSLGYRSISALDTVSNLSQNANSEYVRLEASKDILDRAGIRTEDSQQTQLGNAIQVNIDLK